METDHDSCDEDGGLLDVVSEPVKRSPVYDGEKARRLMGECERFTCFTRPSLASLNSEEDESEDEEMAGWEERIVRDNWSAAQSKLFGKVIFSSGIKKGTLYPSPPSAFLRSPKMNHTKEYNI